MFVFSAGPKHGSAGTVSQAGSALQEQDLQPSSALPNGPAEPELGAGLRAGHRRGIRLQFIPNLAACPGSWGWRQQDGCVGDL